MRRAHVVRLLVAAWLLRWAAMELASRAGRRPGPPPPDGPLPGRMPGPPGPLIE